MVTYTALHEAMDQGLAALANEPLIGLDLETSGLSPWNDKTAVVAMYGPVSKTTAVFHVRGKLPAKLRAFLSEPREWVGHNVCTFDSMFLHNAGVDIFQGTWVDTLIAEQVVITSGRSDVRKNLEATVKRRLGRQLDKSINHGHWMDDHLTPDQLTYVTGDIVHLPELWIKQQEEATKKHVRGALDFELSLIPAVQRMQANGLPCDIHRLREWREKAAARGAMAGAVLDARLGGINLNSPKQLTDALTTLGITLPNTRKETLLELAQHSDSVEKELATLLLEYRFGTKRANTYSDAWIKKFIHQGWLHSRFQQASTDTFRFSSAEPNLQQLPKDEDGNRPYVGWWPGRKIVSCDYSGIEAVVAGACAQDKEYLKVLASDDMHRSVASLVFGIDTVEVSARQRQLAKAMSFTLLFGGGAGRLMQYANNQGAGLTEADAKRITGQFFSRFLGLKAFRSRAYELAKDGMPVTIVLPHGGKRVIFGEKLKGTTLLNTKAQGTAALGMKYALAEAHRRGLTRYLGAVVHDETVAAVPDAEAEDYAAEMRDAMLAGMRSIPVMETAPVKVGASINDYWAK